MVSWRKFKNKRKLCMVFSMEVRWSDLCFKCGCCVENWRQSQEGKIKHREMVKMWEAMVALPEEDKWGSYQEAKPIELVMGNEGEREASGWPPDSWLWSWNGMEQPLSAIAQAKGVQISALPLTSYVTLDLTSPHLYFHTCRTETPVPTSASHCEF